MEELVECDRTFFFFWFFFWFGYFFGRGEGGGNSDAEGREMLGYSQRGFLPNQEFCMRWAASVHTSPHPEWQRISRINLAAKPLSLEHTNCHSFPIGKKWRVVQFAGVPFEYREDGKLTARLQIYGRVICPDAAVLVTAFSFRNRKQGSHLTTTDVVFSWQVFWNLQFNNFSSPNITDEEGRLPTPASRICHLWHSEISEKAEKKVQLLTLSLLWLLHIKTRAIPTSAPGTQQKEEGTTVVPRHMPLKQGQTQELCRESFTHQQ